MEQRGQLNCIRYEASSLCQGLDSELARWMITRVSLPFSLFQTLETFHHLFRIESQCEESWLVSQLLSRLVGWLLSSYQVVIKRWREVGFPWRQRYWGGRNLCLGWRLLFIHFPFFLKITYYETCKKIKTRRQSGSRPLLDSMEKWRWTKWHHWKRLFDHPGQVSLFPTIIFIFNAINAFSGELWDSAPCSSGQMFVCQQSAKVSTTPEEIVPCEIF